jgi:hypothetical protein
MSLSELHAAIIRPQDLGPREYEEDFAAIKYRQTNLYRIRIEYQEDPRSALFLLKDFIPQLRALPIGVYQRKIYLDVQMGQHKVYYRVDTRSLESREMASHIILGGDSYYVSSNTPQHVDYGLHPLQPKNSMILGIKQKNLDIIMRDIERGQLRELLYDRDWRTQ